jgi:C4-dicarboxylate-specific signal transduction histidine kinase
VVQGRQPTLDSTTQPDVFAKMMAELVQGCEEYPLVLADARLSGTPLIWASESYRQLAGTAGPSVGAELSSLHHFATGPWRFSLAQLPEAQARTEFVLGLVGTAESFGSDAFVSFREAVVRRLQVACSALRDARIEEGHLAAQVLRTLGTSIVAVDGRGLVRVANRAALTLLERGERDTLGRPVEEILGRPLAEASRESEAGETRSDHLLVAANGTAREVGVTLMKDVAQGAFGLASTFQFRELGERRHAELELLRVKGLEALGQMAAGFAHEVRNPLAALKTLSEALMMEFQTGDARLEYTTRIVALVGRMEKLVQHSLLFARPRAPVRNRVEPGRLVEHALSSLKQRDLPLTPSIRVTLAATLQAAFCDEEQATEVLLVLLENALDAAGNRAGVAVNVRLDGLPHRPGLWLRLDVIDQGPGIAERNLQRVFHPFFTTKVKALGLSLAIAQRLAHDNGGHLLARAEPGTPTVFSLYLPVAPTVNPVSAGLPPSSIS